MEMLSKFYSANLKSWTVRLGVLLSVLVAVSEMVPQIDAVLTLVWPAGKPWLVVGGMYLGRVIGLLRTVKATADKL